MKNKYQEITDIRERKKQFLKDTIEFYNSKNRAAVKREYGVNQCFYEPVDSSPGCAIGRHIDKEIVRKLWGRVTNNVLFLPKWMLDMGLDFLSRIQELHDTEENWCETGLSEVGKEKVKYIIV